MAIDGPVLLMGLVEALGFDCWLFNGWVMLELFLRKLGVWNCWCVGHFPWTIVSNCVTEDRENGNGMGDNVLYKSHQQRLVNHKIY